MEERIAEKNREQTEKFHANLNALSERNKRERAETSALFAKALQSDREEVEKRRAADIEAEKSKAAKEIEDKYERQGMKSEHTKQIDASLKKMLGNMQGLND